jgi:hypothetical protein
MIATFPCLLHEREQLLAKGGTMERSHQKCVCHLLQCASVVLAAATTYEPVVLNAAMPDVPRIQA